MLTAAEAHAVRLLNETVEPEDLLTAGHRLADRITAQAPLATRLMKSVFHAPRDAHPFVDDVAQAVLFETEDKQARMTAFLDRRQRRSRTDEGR